MDECRGYCLSCKTPCPPRREYCAYCDELFDLDEISEYVSWIDDKEVIEWVCDECVARGVFDEIEEETEAAA